MNEFGIDFNDFVTRYHTCLAEYDPSSNIYNSDAVVWRKGQLFFNLMCQSNPRVAEMLRGSIRDPFHKEQISDEIWDFVMDNWEGQG